MKRGIVILAALLVATSAVQAQELRIGLREDAGSLDPATNATSGGRMSLQQACDKLVDIDPQGVVRPMLAESWEWSEDSKALVFKLRSGVIFHDGTPLDAEAVKFSLERYLTLDGSRRRAEISAINAVEVIDDLTVKVSLRSPSIPLLGQFTDRAGMILSPTAVKAMSPEEFARGPVCAGPYKVVESVPQQRVVLEKFPGHWRADEYHFQRVVYQPIADSNARLLNVRSGDLTIAENISPGDLVSIQGDAKFQAVAGDQPTYENVLFNLEGPGAHPDIARSAAVRQAFSLAIDREAINTVIYGGTYFAGNQPYPPTSPWYNAAHPVPARDVEAAKAKLAEAGVGNITIELLLTPSPDRIATAEMMQAMLSEVGINLVIQPMEFVSMRQRTLEGRFHAYIIGSLGRVDPDLNISLLLKCRTANNVGKYCSDELEAALTEGSSTPDDAKRKAAYDRAVNVILRDAPVVYYLNPRPAYVMSAKVQGFQSYPDGIIRLPGLRLAE